MDNQIELAIKIALDAWHSEITRMDKLFNELTDEQLRNEVSAGRNTGTYLLGHLTAVHDALFPLLGLGQKLYPQLEDIFIKNPDKSGIEKPVTKDLRNYHNILINLLWTSGFKNIILLLMKILRKNHIETN